MPSRERSWPSRRSRSSTGNVDRKRHARSWPQAYLDYLYTPEGQTDRGQELLPAVRRRRSPRADARPVPQARRCVTIDDDFGGWAARPRQTHFADGGVFDQIYKPRKLIDGDASAAIAAERMAPSRSVLPGFGLTLGFTLTYLSLIVLIPLPALFLQAAGVGWTSFWARSVATPRTLAALAPQLRRRVHRRAASTSCSALLVAWVLVRYAFPAGASSTRWSTCRSRCRPRSPASR